MLRSLVILWKAVESNHYLRLLFGPKVEQWVIISWEDVRTKHIFAIWLPMSHSWYMTLVLVGFTRVGHVKKKILWIWMSDFEVSWALDLSLLICFIGRDNSDTNIKFKIFEIVFMTDEQAIKVFQMWTTFYRAWIEPVMSQKSKLKQLSTLEFFFLSMIAYFSI